GRIGFHFTGERCYLLVRQERKHTQELQDVGVLGLHEKLIEAIDAGSPGIEVHGAARGLAVLRPIRPGEQWEREAPHCLPELTPAQLDPRGDVPPLVARAYLQFAAERTVQVVEVIG